MAYGMAIFSRVRKIYFSGAEICRKMPGNSAERADFFAKFQAPTFEKKSQRGKSARNLGNLGKFCQI